MSERPEMVHPKPFLDPAFGDPWRYCYQKGRSYIWGTALPSSCRSVAPLPRCLSPDKKRWKTADLISTYTLC